MSDADALARVEQEILEERAAALERIAVTLDRTLEELERLRVEIARAGGSERDRAVARYARLLRRAERYRWYLVVQREANGLVRHEHALAMFPLPEPIG